MPPKSQIQVYCLVGEQNHCDECYPLEPGGMEMMMVYSTGREVHDHLNQECKSAMVALALASIPPTAPYLQAYPFWDSGEPCDSDLDENYVFLFPLVQQVVCPCTKSGQESRCLFHELAWYHPVDKMALQRNS